MEIPGQNFKPDELIDPLDYLILGGLPEEGEMFAGAYPDGRTSRQLSRELFDGQVKPTIIGPRCNSLVYQGLVVKKKGVGTNGSYIYQRTAAGKTVYETWKANHDG